MSLSEPKPEQSTPVPVIPLDYARSEGEAPRRILKLVALAYLVGQFSAILHFANSTFCYLLEQSGTATARKLLDGGPLVIGTPNAVVCLYLVANTPAILALSGKGRRYLRAGMIVQAILSPITNIALAIFMANSHRLFNYGVAYGLYYTVPYVVSAAIAPIELLIYYRIFGPMNEGTEDGEPLRDDPWAATPLPLSTPVTSSSGSPPPDRNSDNPTPPP